MQAFCFYDNGGEYNRLLLKTAKKCIKFV